MNFDQTIITKSMKDAVKETFEGLVFLEVDHSDVVDAPELDGDCLVTDVVIKAPFEATIKFLVNKSFCKNLVEAITGGESSGDLINDTLSEILNVIAGRFMSNILRGEQDFVIEIPVAHFIRDVEQHYRPKKDDLGMEFYFGKNKAWVGFIPTIQKTVKMKA